MDALYDFFCRKLCGVKKLTILGVGSLLRADDGAGILAVENLQAIYKQKKCSNVQFCVGETAPENFSGKIRSFHPTHLLIIDAADLGREPGSIVEIDPRDVGGPTFCSHMLPLKVMVNYLVGETGTSTTLLGIQYGNIDFDGGMTDGVKETVKELCTALETVINELLCPDK